ncbi:MAG: putative endonuclease [Hyphomonadaceae bacterium]|nr:MAG: putative endonuclease [Hyphomonadaceae bacterium]
MRSPRPRKSRQSAEKYGRFGEFAAAILLTLSGYQVLEWRKKTFMGELDLVARRGNFLVFVEVKVRKTLDEAQFAISVSQQKRIIKAASLYCHKRHWTQNFTWRYDVVAIAPWRFPRHIIDAFRPIN